ncbi:MAG TPA: hypothetical protein VFM54_13220 [Micromonosporaceae bacterium]|nr:hypothetical protein [Micromonosporaceae bacterium]
MDENEDQVLRLRLEGLKTNLEQVRDIRASVASRRKEIHDLLPVFDAQEGIQQLAQLLTADLKTCRDLTVQISGGESVPKRVVERLHTRLKEAELDAGTIAEKAHTSARIIKAMGRRWSAIPSDSFDRHIDEIFAKQAQALIDQIDSLRNKEPAEAWRTYRATLRRKSDDLFSEYVEFLGGLALRDTGLGGLPLAPADPSDPEFDPDVYHMADDLIKQIYYIGGTDLWHSMAIPARRDAAARTLARMIRLGFPEWTVWAVPLGAFEFGRVVVDVNSIVKSYGHKHGGADRGLEIALADAFATFTMGPSHAFASIVLRLEPGPGWSDSDDAGEPRGEDDERTQAPVSDAERAYVLFAMLRLMDADGVYANVVSGLESIWHAALRQVDADEDLPEETEARLEKWTRHMWDFLATKASGVMYRPVRYEAATRWELLTDLARSDRIEEWQLKPGEEDVRDILNAAWLQRLREGAPAQRDLAKAALKLWRRDLEGRSIASGRPTKRGG